MARAHASPASRPARGPAWLALALLLTTGACRTGTGSGDLGLRVSGLPGVEPGFALAIDQRFLERPELDLDLTLGLIRTRLDEAADGEDDALEARVGLRARLDRGATWRPWIGAGAVWMRARGRPHRLGAPGDYGGAFLAVGLERSLGGGWSLGPRAEVLFLDAEGGGDSGRLPRVGLDLVWRP